MKNILILAQAIVSLILIALILLQQRGAALGSIFGGEGGSYGTMRGLEKKFFFATIFFGVLFIALAILNLAF